MSEFPPEKLTEDAETLGVHGLQERIDALLRAYPELGLAGVRRVLRLPELPKPRQRFSSGAGEPEPVVGFSRSKKGPCGGKVR